MLASTFSTHNQQYYKSQPLNTEINRQSINSRHDLDDSDHGSRLQTSSVLLTSPEAGILDTNPPSQAEDFQTYAQLMIHMAKSLDLQIH